MTTRIYDVSAYQPARLNRQVDAYLIKATEGKGYVSDTYASQRLTALDLSEHQGAYHYARPEESSPKDQLNRFLDKASLEPQENSAWLDLESSDLGQRVTHDWAQEWGERLRSEMPGLTSGLYIGNGYITKRTAAGLSKFFDLWWWPFYPGAYQYAPIMLQASGMEEARAINRSHTGRNADKLYKLGLTTTRWPNWDPKKLTALPKGNTTGWDLPNAWQFTDNLLGWDASITPMTTTELAWAATSKPGKQGVDMPGDIPPTRLHELHSYGSAGQKVNVFGVIYDSPQKLTYKFNIHMTSGQRNVKQLTVGGAVSAKDGWPKKPTFTTTDDTVDWWSIELIKCEGPVDPTTGSPMADWDPTMPDENGRIVRPFWDAWHK